MKTSKNTTLSIGILFAAFTVALALRLIRLGVLPLGDQEASLALQALAVGTRGDCTLWLLCRVCWPDWI